MKETLWYHALVLGLFSLLFGICLMGMIGVNTLAYALTHSPAFTLFCDIFYGTLSARFLADYLRAWWKGARR